MKKLALLLLVVTTTFSSATFAYPYKLQEEVETFARWQGDTIFCLACAYYEWDLSSTTVNRLDKDDRFPMLRDSIYEEPVIIHEFAPARPSTWWLKSSRSK